MFGFTIIYDYHNQKLPESDVRIDYKNPQSGRSHVFLHHMSDAFRNEKALFETKTLIIGLDGFLLNLERLEKAFAVSGIINLLNTLYDRYSDGFFDVLRGEFTGFVFDKASGELFFYMNQTGTKAVFYVQSENCFIVSPSLKELLSLSALFIQKPILDVDAAYSLLVMGGMTGNQTLAQGVRRLLAGEKLHWSAGTLSVTRYHDFNSVSTSIHSRKEAVTRLDELFRRNIQLEYERDAAHAGQFVATLSGGLDSRMNVMAANAMGIKTKNFCFSQPGYADQRISQKISDDLGCPHAFVSLEEGNYVLEIDENLAIHEGLVFYVSSAHYRYALMRLPFPATSLIHTGQIGDAVLGGFMPKPNAKPDYYSKRLSSKLLHKLPAVQPQEWSSEEVFRIYNRLFNVTVSGSYVTEHMGMYLVSPFLEPDFIDLCLSLDPSLKVNSRIYIDWIREKRPDVARYTWERTGFRPDAAWKTDMSVYTNKLKNAARRLTGSRMKHGMNPYDFWYMSNAAIRTFVHKQFTSNIHNLDNTELKNDCVMLFEQGNTIEKTLVLTLLSAMKYLGLKT